MFKVICDFCGNEIPKEEVFKITIKPVYGNKRKYECCIECVNEIENRLFTIKDESSFVKGENEND